MLLTVFIVSNDISVCNTARYGPEIIKLNKNARFHTNTLYIQRVVFDGKLRMFFQGLADNRSLREGIEKIYFRDVEVPERTIISILHECGFSNAKIVVH